MGRQLDNERKSCVWDPKSTQMIQGSTPRQGPFDISPSPSHHNNMATHLLIRLVRLIYKN